MSNKKPILVVMAAGMGSRYGGLKQIDPVGANGEVILDYSVYDAKRAGFESVIFILSAAVEADFRETIGKRMEKQLDISYAIQRLEDLPAGYTVPTGRTKPWGTAQAVYSARNLIDRPFAVLNADDYYGPDAFRLIFNQLEQNKEKPIKEQFAMVGYHLQNTVTAHGHVARGVCQVGADGKLAGIQERTRIQCFPDGIKFSEDEGIRWTPLASDTVVSMNFWGFPKSIVDEIGQRFPAFLDNAIKTNPMKAEFYVPVLVDDLIRDNIASVKVLESHDKWYGVTYQADKKGVVEAIAALTAEGLYPEKLWY